MCAHCGVAAMLCAQVTAPCAARSLADGTGPLCGSFVACGCNVNVAAVQLGAPRPRRASPHGGAPPPTKATARAKFTRESRVGRRKSSAVQPRDLTACDAARWPRPLRRATICTRRSSASSSLRVGVCSRRPAPSPARCAHVRPVGAPRRGVRRVQQGQPPEFVLTSPRRDRCRSCVTRRPGASTPSPPVSTSMRWTKRLLRPRRRRTGRLPRRQARPWRAHQQ